MKQGMIFAIIMLTAIVVAASFGVQLMPVVPVQVPPAAAGAALYVCPVTSTTWDAISVGLRPFSRYITIGIFFAFMVLLFNWGWAMYQNLLADKFQRKAFSTPWKFTKALFWAVVIFTILAATPNHFKTVQIRGVAGDWVLCENNTPGARAVRADAVTLR